ncbi:MAG TPA: helix-turn-helix transcriptional regulator [Puia sp.]|jgi:transcriptional regulator with XRE-family HTH domain|nr:helix-turn-helix transcriptional regulator [Puia sp.]
MDRQGDFLRLLGRRINELREERRLTIEALAMLTGLDPGDLAAMEAGKIDIQLTTIYRLARGLGITAGEFLNFPGDI